jgi:hypothetical protein
MPEVFRTLQTYTDWLASHPSEALVANVDTDANGVGNSYKNILQNVAALVNAGLHAYPDPTIVTSIKVLQTPEPFLGENGRQEIANGHLIWLSAQISAVESGPVTWVLNAQGVRVATLPALPPTRYLFVFTMLSNENTIDGQWRIQDATKLAN